MYSLTAELYMMYILAWIYYFNHGVIFELIWTPFRAHAITSACWKNSMTPICDLLILNRYGYVLVVKLKIKTNGSSSNTEFIRIYTLWYAGLWLDNNWIKFNVSTELHRILWLKWIKKIMVIVFCFSESIAGAGKLFWWTVCKNYTHFLWKKVKFFLNLRSKRKSEFASENFINIDFVAYCSINKIPSPKWGYNFKGKFHVDPVQKYKETIFHFKRIEHGMLKSSFLFEFWMTEDHLISIFFSK